MRYKGHKLANYIDLLHCDSQAVVGSMNDHLAFFIFLERAGFLVLFSGCVVSIRSCRDSLD